MLLLSSSSFRLFFLLIPLHASYDEGKMCTEVNQTESQTVHPVLPPEHLATPEPTFPPLPLPGAVVSSFSRGIQNAVSVEV